MKNYFIIAFMLFSSLIYAQTGVAGTVEEGVGDVSQEQITTAERIIDKYSGKIHDLIKEMAEGLQVPAEYVWKVLVRQAYVDSITYLLVGIFGIWWVFMLIKFVTKIVDWDDLTDRDGKKHSPGELIIKIILAIIGLIMTIVFVCSFGTIVQGFVNPEYKAIELIIEALNG